MTQQQLDEPIDFVIPPPEELNERLKWLDKVRSCPMGVLATRFELALAEVAEIAQQIEKEVPRVAPTAWGVEYLAPGFEEDTREWLRDVSATGRLAESMGNFLSAYMRS